MTVKEVIILAAEELGIGDAVKGYFDGDGAQGVTETMALLRCFNLVENEVALDYLPLFAEDTVLTETGVVEYSALSKTPVRILSVKDESGNSVKYKIYPSYLAAQAGELSIRYTYTPNTKTLTDSSDFVLFVSDRLLAFGVAAEYCFSCGLYDEGEAWNKKYKDALKAAYRAKPAKVLRSRRWE
jgi:hypothetical protein